MDRDLEVDLSSCSWFVAKVRASDSYAQNVYAALCNMRWQPQEVWPVLQDDYWSCTWRYAGELVADLRVDFNEDYMDFYCSGLYIEDTENTQTPEGTVTPEISECFEELNMVLIQFDDLC